MKQLKFMLAAATAVGIAAAAQAATKTLESENFNAYSTEKAVVGETGIDGFTFVPGEGETQSDNESAIVANPNGVEGDKSLSVNTGKSPLLRQIRDEDSGIVDLADINHLEIDTLVQFTVTPWSDKDNVTPGNADKLMIYLQEDLSDETAPVTNLVVKAGYLGESLTTETYELDLSGLVITNNVWYKLKVRAYANVGDPALATDFGTYSGFSISIGPENAETLTVAKIANGKCFSDADSSVGPLVFNEQSPHGPDLAAGKVFLSRVNNTQLTHVGFAGEGKVDDFVVTKDYNASSLDFTLDLGDNVSAVSWTVNGDAQDEDEYTFTAASGVTSFTVAIASVTYAPGYAGTKDWTGWTSNITESTTIPIEATKFADVTTDGEATQITPTADTIEAAANGAFACPASDAADYAVAVEKLGKAVTWATSVAKKSYNDAMKYINAMDFANVTTNNVEEAAYLFNCEPTPAAIAAEAAAFKFPSFTKDMTIDAMKAAVEADKDYNGTVEIHGATTLEAGGDWAKDKQGAFYKAVLTK